MSLGIDWSAARKVIAKNGIPHQTLAMIGPHKAWLGSERMFSGAAISPVANSQCGTGPTTGLNSQAQLRPDRKAGTAQGRKTRACTSARPGNLRLRSKARASPNTNWSATEATVQRTVLRSAFQKFASAHNVR